MSPGESYSRLDRWLHHLAFKAITPQKAMADIEESLFATRLEPLAVTRPVFITSLPRAGTTLLLELLAGTDRFATHTYRDMPFVLCPLLWERLSSGFRTSDPLRERAHGDGISINSDSPEAFEEILWKAFWPRNYRSGPHPAVVNTGSRYGVRELLPQPHAENHRVALCGQTRCQRLAIRVEEQRQYLASAPARGLVPGLPHHRPGA